MAGGIAHGHGIQQHLLARKAQGRSFVGPIHLPGRFDHGAGAVVGIDPEVRATVNAC